MPHSKVATFAGSFLQWDKPHHYSHFWLCRASPRLGGCWQHLSWDWLSMTYYVSNFQSSPLNLDNFSIHGVSSVVLFAYPQCHAQHKLVQLVLHKQRARGPPTTLLAAVFVLWQTLSCSDWFLLSLFSPYLEQLSQGWWAGAHYLLKLQVLCLQSLNRAH